MARVWRRPSLCIPRRLPRRASAGSPVLISVSCLKDLPTRGEPGFLILRSLNVAVRCSVQRDESFRTSTARRYASREVQEARAHFTVIACLCLFETRNDDCAANIALSSRTDMSTMERDGPGPETECHEAPGAASLPKSCDVCACRLSWKGKEHRQQVAHMHTCSAASHPEVRGSLTSHEACCNTALGSRPGTKKQHLAANLGTVFRLNISQLFRAMFMLWPALSHIGCRLSAHWCWILNCSELQPAREASGGGICRSILPGHAESTQELA